MLGVQVAERTGCMAAAVWTLIGMQGASLVVPFIAPFGPRRDVADDVRDW